MIRSRAGPSGADPLRLFGVPKVEALEGKGRGTVEEFVSDFVQRCCLGHVRLVSVLLAVLPEPRSSLAARPDGRAPTNFAHRNYMEFAKAVATQLPQVTVDHELVFQFYRVCSEVHNCTLSATPKLLQHAGAAAPCYQVRRTPFFENLDFSARFLFVLCDIAGAATPCRAPG